MNERVTLWTHSSNNREVFLLPMILESYSKFSFSIWYFAGYQLVYLNTHVNRAIWWTIPCPPIQSFKLSIKKLLYMMFEKYLFYSKATYIDASWNQAMMSLLIGNDFFFFPNLRKISWMTFTLFVLQGRCKQPIWFST